MRTTDLLGNAVTLAEGASLGAVNDFVGGFISSEARAANILQAAGDASPWVQAASAALHMFAESREGSVNARPFIQAALNSPLQATAGELRFVQAVAAWVAGDIPQALRLHEEQARLQPRDLVSLKLGQYHLFNQGDAPAMLRLALTVAPAASDVPYLHGMLAFGYEQCHLLQKAEHAARTGIALCRKEPWAHHALAHVMLTQGRVSEGLRFMHDVSDTWTGLNSFMLTHNWWHTALFALELGDADTVLRLYDEQIWGAVKSYSQDQINAISLLARLELAGVNVGDRWLDVGQALSQRTADQVLPFLDMQYLYGLARAGLPQAGVLMANIARFAAQSTANGTGGSLWSAVCVPACEGLLAHARGDWKTAVVGLGAALPRLRETGGSHAQRDLFEQIFLDALIRSGQHSAAQQLLQQRVNQQPESVRLRQQARALYNSLGLSPELLGGF